MTFEEYINNPSGKGAANMPARYMYEQFYTEELDKLLLKINGKIEYNLFVDREKYYIRFKIPHHTYENFFYDVVIEFSTDDNALRVVRDLKKYNVKFFSNDPSFTFTWAYAFNKNGLLIPSLRSKCSRKSLSEAPVIRNPSETTGYCKYIYYAYLLTKLYNLFEKSEFTLKSKSISILGGTVVNADKKYEQRLTAQKEYSKLTKAKKENLEHDNARNTRSNTNPDYLIGLSATVRNTKKITPKSNTTRVIPKTNKTKKI